jgi:glycosyltransferase involved in cell wall biosynthesis
MKTISQRSKVIWLAWEKHRRSQEISKYLKVKSILLEDKRRRIIRHPILMIKTFKIIYQEKPKVLIVQNPSIFLAIIACLLLKLKFAKYYLIVDAHNEGVIPFNKRYMIFGRIYRWIQRTADLTIVSNECLSEIVKKNGGSPFILPDKIPDPGRIAEVNLPGIFNYVVISTYASDEPIHEIIVGANELDNGDKLYITGNYNAAKGKFILKRGDNVVLTGYLKEEEYWGYLKNAHCIIDLTLMDDCIVCGAYEALAVGTPMILSNSGILRKTFYKGAIFTNNDSESIKAALKEVKRIYKKLSQEIGLLKEEYDIIWQEEGEHLISIINEKIERSTIKEVK